MDVDDAVCERGVDVRDGDVTTLGTGQAGRGGNVKSTEGGSIKMDRVAITGGDAYVGAGVYLYSVGQPATLRITRSSFNLNAATGLGGGLDIDGEVTAKISKSSFRENSVTAPSDTSSAGAISNRGVILDAPDPCEGTVIDSGGYNLATTDDSACDFRVNDDAPVASLGLKPGFPAENGGATRAIALKKTSPAIDFVPEGSCNVAAGEDQRGYKRKGACDAGAYERKAKPPTR